MNKRQKNKLQMLDAVQAYLSTHRSVFAEFPAIDERLAELKKAHEKISAKEDFQLTAAVASTAEKSQTRINAEITGSSLAGILYDFGKKTGNTEFISKYDVNISYLMSIRDVNLVIFLNALISDTEANKEELTDYEINTETIAGFIQKFNAYFNAVSSKERVAAEKRAAVQSIAGSFSDADEILRSLDKLVEKYRNTDPEFFNGYKSARTIKDLGMRRKAIPETTHTQSAQ
jgi:hypothetical protein